MPTIITTVGFQLHETLQNKLWKPCENLMKSLWLHGVECRPPVLKSRCCLFKQKKHIQIHSNIVYRGTSSESISLLFGNSEINTKVYKTANRTMRRTVKKFNAALLRKVNHRDLPSDLTTENKGIFNGKLLDAIYFICFSPRLLDQTQ